MSKKKLMVAGAAVASGLALWFAADRLGTYDDYTVSALSSPGTPRLVWWDKVELFSVDGDGSTNTVPLLGYSNTNLSTIAVGGIAVGSAFTNSTLTQIMDRMLYPELFGVLSAPTRSFTSTQTGLREVGATLSITFNSSFNRGAINPQYESASQYRSGLPSGYEFDHVNVVAGKQLTNTTTTALSDVQTIADYEVVLGEQTWLGRVSYSEGVQPRGSNGTAFDAPLAAGQTAYISRTIVGVYPFYATTSAITNTTKQSLLAHGSTIEVAMVAESGGDKQVLEFPEAWGTYTGLQQYNTLSGNWDAIDAATFTSTDFDIGAVPYKRLTHNGGTIGARQLRFTF